MFSKVLVANRGEIACRVIRSLRELGIATVAVASEADRAAKHVRLADEVRIIGPAASNESYLRADRIIAAAVETGAQAIHPGYGFLSESEALVKACAAAGITFVGPSSEAMRVMGEKTSARRAMTAAGVPVVPGTTEASPNGEAALPIAREIGFPIMLKAAAGGGGKGMRLALSEEGFVESFDACSREARSAFGDGSVYLERAIQRPRHIEIQVLADGHGNAVYLFERECSVQRRHQKVVEEAPAANLSEPTRQAMGEVAVRAAQAIQYEGAGTVEFLVDAEENFFFLEMNTRLQVEHPVTELICGVDLVRQQLRVAAGFALPFAQADLVRRGHAIECRLYAEDPYNKFLPSPGTLLRYRPPSGPGFRVDDGVDEGDVVTPYYDPMLAKLVCWGEDRAQAIERMRAGLRQLRVAGIKTNAGLLDSILANAEFASGVYDTGLIERMMPLEPAQPSRESVTLAAVVAAALHARAASGPKSNGDSAQPVSRWANAARSAAVQRWRNN